MGSIIIRELAASSGKSFDDAFKIARKKADKTYKNISSIQVKEMKAVVENHRVISYGIKASVSFSN